MLTKVIVFDLDDTLYDELDYVRSGLRHTGQVLSERYRWDPEDTERQLLASLDVSRDKIFDRVLTQKGVNTPELVKFCVETYRSHWPSIRLSNKVKRLIKLLARQYPLYIVTDGHAEVQKNKLEVLGLLNNPLIKACYVTDELGADFVKPSPRCFEDIARREQCQPEQVVYVADNPDKDFVGIKPVGFRTVRVLNGQHRNKTPEAKYEAEFAAPDLTEAVKMALVDQPMPAE